MALKHLSGKTFKKLSLSTKWLYKKILFINSYSGASHIKQVAIGNGKQFSFLFSLGLIHER